MQIAFSTVACPDWTLERVMSFADEVEFDGVELRTFGWGSADFACDPALTDPGKVRRMAIESGTEVMCLATSLKFDDPIRPPVLGRVLPGSDRWLQAALRHIELADRLECPCVRVFGFECPPGERRSRAVARIVERLGEVLAAAGKRRVTVVLENGGSFCRASEVVELVRAIDHPRLGVAYDIAVGFTAGDDRVESALDLFGDRLVSVKCQDLRDRTPVELGTGDMPIERAVRHLAGAGFGGWLVAEWVRCWRPELGEPDGVLRRALEKLGAWAYAEAAGSAPAPVGVGA
jgi:sugar phosphate isomerase/epimerase